MPIRIKLAFLKLNIYFFFFFFIKHVAYCKSKSLKYKVTKPQDAPFE